MRRFIWLTLVMILPFLPATTGMATENQQQEELFFLANQAYRDGHFQEAIDGYRKLIESGHENGHLFYNLGNAYFKQGDYGRAILYYRRAEQLAPRDPDVAANLELARAQTGDQLEATDGEGFFSRLTQFVQGWLTLNELATITLGVWFLFAFLLIVFSGSKTGSAWRKGLQYGLVVTSLALAVGIFALASCLYAENNHSEGLVVASEVNVTSGPGSQYVTEFTLHNGAEVNLVETRGNWVRLALPGGELQGWAPASAVEAVAMHQ